MLSATSIGRRPPSHTLVTPSKPPLGPFVRERCHSAAYYPPRPRLAPRPAGNGTADFSHEVGHATIVFFGTTPPAPFQLKLRIQRVLSCGGFKATSYPHQMHVTDHIDGRCYRPHLNAADLSPLFGNTARKCARSHIKRPCTQFVWRTPRSQAEEKSATHASCTTR